MGIETYKETNLHRQLKELYSGGNEYTEIKCGNWVCDIINKDGEITEIQTRNLSALERKVRELTRTRSVRIIHPIIEKKTIEKTDKTGTKIISRRTSPKKETPEKIFKELTRLWPYINNPNFTILLVCCDIIELRRETEEKKFRGNNYTVENKTLININKEITLAGHEIGSMFFTTSDLNSSKYKIDKNFISRGLARNEDDYYGITGKELSLLWHPAYYTLSDIIVSAGKEAGYTYVGYDVDSLDWVCLEDSGTLTGLYMNSSKLVERILAEKKPGSVIPIRVGSPAGTRTDYLYDKLELLINGLLESGYDIVPVSSLIKDSM